jgi:hypothetical protein
MGTSFLSLYLCMCMVNFFILSNVHGITVDAHDVMSMFVGQA